MHGFIDREYEKKALLSRITSEKPEFLVIYGKRRVGKTELVKHTFDQKNFLYLLADKRSDKDLLQDLTRKAGLFFNDEIVGSSGLPDWLTFLRYLSKKAQNDRIMVVFDEFPYLSASNRAIPSLFQKAWDEHMKDSRILLVLMGSSITMMEKGVLSYRSPLYGRRTGQIFLQPMLFQASREFFPKRSIREQIEFHSVLGGMPAYLLQFSQDRDVFQNIEENILRRDAFLYNEVEFVLREELREPRIYFSILKEIAFGRTTVNEISQNVGIDRNALSKYLFTLENLRIIRKEVPPTTPNPHKFRKGLYRISDEFFRFWFGYVFPNKGLIERGDEKTVMGSIKGSFDAYVGVSFENVCMEALLELSRHEKEVPTLTSIGRWWEKNEEIDIVAINDMTDDICFAECKWQRRRMGPDVAIDLMDKAKKVQWGSEKRREHYFLFSRSGFSQKCLDLCDEKGIKTFDLEDIGSLLH